MNNHITSIIEKLSIINYKLSNGEDNKLLINALENTKSNITNLIYIIQEKEKENERIIRKIITIFYDNVKNKQIVIDKNNHCGSEGCWLEYQFGITANNKNEPDLFGYELKKIAKKITFGDYSASEYLFTKSSQRELINKYNNCFNINITRSEFISYFGTKKYNINLKKYRYSWSGSCVPKYGIYNNCGQILLINSDNDICIYYSHCMDNRKQKYVFPKYLWQDNLLIAIWKYDRIKKLINNKFNQKGFIICNKLNNVYNTISFGRSFSISDFLNGIKNKKIIFDSGMYEGNTRNYSHFRSSYTNFWKDLIIQTY